MTGAAVQQLGYSQPTVYRRKSTDDLTLIKPAATGGLVGVGRVRASSPERSTRRRIGRRRQMRRRHRLVTYSR
jgi:hypothetical protein